MYSLIYLTGLTVLSIGVANLPTGTLAEGLIWWGSGLITLVIVYLIPK